MLDKYQQLLESLKGISRGPAIYFQHKETLEIMKGGLENVRPIQKKIN